MGSCDPRSVTHVRPGTLDLDLSSPRSGQVCPILEREEVYICAKVREECSSQSRLFRHYQTRSGSRFCSLRGARKHMAFNINRSTQPNVGRDGTVSARCTYRWEGMFGGGGNLMDGEMECLERIGEKCGDFVDEFHLDRLCRYLDLQQLRRTRASFGECRGLKDNKLLDGR